MKRPLWLLLIIVVALGAWALWPRHSVQSPEAEGLAPAPGPNVEERATTPMPAVPSDHSHAPSPTPVPSADASTPAATSPALPSTSSAGDNSAASEIWDRSHFAESSAQLLRDLPRQADLRKLPAEMVEHGPPPAIIAIGERLGELREALGKDPQLVPDAIEFYGKCAAQSGVSNTVRALCFSNARKYSRDEGKNFDLEVPETVRRLADALPEI